MKNQLEKFIDKITRRRSCYRETFTGPIAQEVLADLARFCRAHETTFKEDPRQHALLEGRREVWLRIQQYTKLTEEELLSLFNINQKGE